MYTQTISDLTSLDPIKANDGSINQLNTNMYVRLVNLSDDDQVVSDALFHTITQLQKEMKSITFVFDDINFAKVENDEAVDTGKSVSGPGVYLLLEPCQKSSLFQTTVHLVFMNILMRFL